MSVNNNPDVVIIGGGIAGACTLYYLSKFGIKNVLLIEKANYLAYGITRHTAGQVMLQMDNEFDILLSQYSLDELKQLQELTGINLYKNKTGMLTVSPGVPFSERLQKWFYRQESLGIPTEIWDIKKIQSKVPLLNIHEIDFGIFSKQDGVVDADRLVNTYAKCAQELGAKVNTDVEATNIRIEKNQVVGVETNRGFISTKIVVNSAGLDARIVGSWIGLDLPLSNTWRFNGFTKQIKSHLVPEDMPTIEVLHEQSDKTIYMGPQTNGVDFTIGVFPVAQYGNYASPRLMLEEERYSSELEYRFPLLFDNTSYEDPHGGQFDEKRGNGSPRCIVKHEGFPQDSNPILGPVNSVKGYYNNCGWGGLGITHGPIGGKLVAASIAEVTDLPTSLEPFLLKRFETNDHTEGKKENA